MNFKKRYSPRASHLLERAKKCYTNSKTREAVIGTISRNPVLMLLHYTPNQCRRKSYVIVLQCLS